MYHYRNFNDLSILVDFVYKGYKFMIYRPMIIGLEDMGATTIKVITIYKSNINISINYKIFLEIKN